MNQVFYIDWTKVGRSGAETSEVKYRYVSEIPKAKQRERKAKNKRAAASRKKNRK